MDSERSRSAAVLCRSRWERDAKEHDAWSRNEVRELRAREDSRTPPRSRRGNEADPRDWWKAPQSMDPEWSRSAAVLCRSGWKRDAKEPGVWSRTRFASRERERTRALQDAAALLPVAAEGTRGIPGTGGNLPKRWTPNGPGVRQSSAALPGNGTRKNTAFGPARGSRVESARGLTHSKTLPRSAFR